MSLFLVVKQVFQKHIKSLFIVKYASLLFLLCCFSSYGQEQRQWIYNHLSPLQEDSSEVIKIDHLGQIYQLNNNQLKKTTPKKELFFRDDFWGEITYFDVYNPLRILIYSKENNTILFLDNQLAVVSEVELNDLNLFDIAGVCSSYDNGFWLFNQQNFSLEYYDKSLTKKYSSENLSYKIHNSSQIKAVFFNNQNVYLQVNQLGILVFDMFAHYIKTIPITQARNVLLTNNGLFFTQKNDIYFYDFKRMQSYPIYKAENTISNLNYYSQELIFNEGNMLKHIFPKIK